MTLAGAFEKLETYRRHTRSMLNVVEVGLSSRLMIWTYYEAAFIYMIINCSTDQVLYALGDEPVF